MAESAGGGPSTASTSTVTHAPFSGWIETTGDALIILEAAKRGIIPRITRRPMNNERKMIQSGSVFVFDECESGIKRWTDGLFWSPSRISGNFLLYRETSKKGQGHKTVKKKRNKTASGGSLEEFNFIQDEEDDESSEGLAMRRSAGNLDPNGLDKHRERVLLGSLTNSNKFKPEGLVKKTFSVTVGEVAQHLISYYSVEDVERGRLRCPSSLPELIALEISPEYLHKDNFRLPPIIDVGPDGQPRYRRDADPSEVGIVDMTSPPPFTTGLPLLSNGSAKERRPAPYRKPSKKSSSKQSDEPISPLSSPTSHRSPRSHSPNNSLATYSHFPYPVSVGQHPPPYAVHFSPPPSQDSPTTPLQDSPSQESVLAAPLQYHFAGYPVAFPAPVGAFEAGPPRSLPQQHLPQQGWGLYFWPTYPPPPTTPSPQISLIHETGSTVNDIDPPVR